MNFNEWIKDKPSLFTEIQNIKPSTFISSYGAENIDLLYRMKYGMKTVPQSMEGLTVVELANLIVINYGENWNNKHTLLTDEILLGVDSKTEVEETVNDGTIRISNSNNENKVSAFNDDELVTNDSDSNTINDDTQKEITRNRTTTKTNLNTIQTQLEMFNSNFIHTVCEDVSKLISLSIY